MVKRPYINNNIIELEKLFESSKHDSKVISEIYNELNFRKTHRALELRKKLEELSNTKEKPSVKEETKKERSYIKCPKNIETTNNYELKLEENIYPSKDYFESNLEPEVTRVKKDTTSFIAPSIHPGPDAILASWLTLEVLTPQPLPNAQELESIHRQLVRLDEIAEPWNDERFKKKGRETAIYWMVYLGELDLSKAVESILETFPDESYEERSEVRGNTTLAVIILDSQGRPVQDKTFLSSFAWGYGKVRAGKLNELAMFTDNETEIKSKIEKVIIKQNEEGEIQPVSYSELIKISEWLVVELNLPSEQVILPGLAVRVPQFSWYNEAPEPELLNSFFIEDISKVRGVFFKGKVGQALRTYMGVSSAREKRDIVKNQTLLSETLAPERMPLTRWPCRGRYPLFLMQQAAINHAVKELENDGLVAVNGPPGTGKTTLLRDIVAKVVLDRAIAMSQFENPEYAFKHIASMKTGKAFSHLYQLDDRLLGHEIVIASSNNKAVENISREIPSSAAIAEDFNPPLKYFQAISDAVAAKDGELVSGSTWGLLAAVLGNSANKSAFVKSFWWDKQRGMSSYLSSIIGGITPENEDENDENSEQSTISEVVLLENPPRNEIEALNRWQIARKDFQNKLIKVSNLRKKAQDIYNAVSKELEVIEQLHRAARELDITKQELHVAEDTLKSSQMNHQKALDDEKRAIEDRRAIELLRPSFFIRLLRMKSYKEWQQSMLDSISVVKVARDNAQKTYMLTEQANNSFNSIKSTMTKKEEEKAKLDHLYQNIIKTITEGQKIMGVNLADNAFWEQDDKTKQILSPWTFKDLQDARDDLFYSSFMLHRAFIDASAKFIRHNIRVTLEILKGRALSDKQELARRSLWASLFMVVPVISTTFASTSRLFGKLGQEELGWLLIDEAGQATPQAALGALWRAKRAIVIGDPLQIEPVVTIPQKLINSIFSQFVVTNDEWAAPDVSAQILADRSSWFGTTLNSEDGELWVGSPLRVHRRCEQPMFSISNYIAYNGLMVYGTKQEDSAISEILGRSIWINVSGSASGKWSEDEGKVVLNMLRQLLQKGIVDPDIFFITPFKMVALKLREMIRNDRWIATHLPKKAWEWTNERVGTIHTFQGKEADTVVLILGAPLESSAGARRWAGGIPNLLNVAVTRAKRRIYVIGNHKAWKNEGYFKYLASSVTVKEVEDWFSQLK